METELTRRRLAQIAAGVMTAVGATPAAAQQQASPDTASYSGPLSNGKPPEGRHFDPVAYSRAQFDAVQRQLGFQARTRAQAQAWQKRLRAKVTELVGGFPNQRVPLRPVTLETREFPAYRRETIVFESRPGMSVLAYVLIPQKPARTPLPSMICVPGHGRGVDDIVGIDEKGQDRTDKAGYQHDFAIQVAEAGLAAVAIEPLAFGCRRHPVAARESLSRNSCNPSAGAALLLGETMIAWRVYDVMRTIDYIETRTNLDAGRVGCMGISGGGTCTTFAGALEPRIRVALISGYLNTFRDSIGSISHCIDNYVPGILRWAEMYDVAGLIAPRPLFVESGVKDRIFPIQASIDSFQRVKQIYATFDAEDQAEQEVFEDAHSFWGKKGIPFLVRHLTA
jgi:hypothetical protein